VSLVDRKDVAEPLLPDRSNRPLDENNLLGTAVAEMKKIFLNTMS